MKMEPFGLSKFSLNLIAFFAQFEANRCAEASCGLVAFPLFYRHFSWLFFGVLGAPNSPFVLFRPENGLFRHPKYCVLKGNRHAMNETGQTTKRTNGSIFTHVQGGGV